MTPARVWVTWVAANVIPSFVVSIFLLGARSTLGTNGSVIAAYALLFGLVSGLQALVWGRWRSTRPGGTVVGWSRWVGRTIIGLVVAMFFGVGILATLDGLGYERAGLVAGWTVAGAIVGAAQASTLGESGKWAWWWVTTSSAGWASAAAVYSVIAHVGATRVQPGVVRWLVGGLAVEGNTELAITAMTFGIYAMLTGIVLAWLAPRRVAPAR